MRHEVNIERLINENNEDQDLRELLQSACRLYILEQDLGDNVDAVVDVDFPGGSSFQSLHTRLLLIYRDQGDREEHYCFRALQRDNAIAYQNRLTAAMTASGIDRNLKFRHLLILRGAPVPDGPVSQELTERFHKAGGILWQPANDELRTLAALTQLETQGRVDFTAWLKELQPISKLPMMRAAGLSPRETKRSSEADPDNRSDEERTGEQS